MELTGTQQLKGQPHKSPKVMVFCSKLVKDDYPSEHPPSGSAFRHDIFVSTECIQFGLSGQKWTIVCGN
jgi:hypothetical protein